MIDAAASVCRTLYKWLDKDAQCGDREYPIVGRTNSYQAAWPSNETVLLNFLRRQPVAVSLWVDLKFNNAFRLYRGGFFNACPPSQPQPFLKYDYWMALIGAILLCRALPPHSHCRSVVLCCV